MSKIRWVQAKAQLGQTAPAVSAQPAASASAAVAPASSAVMAPDLGKLLLYGGPIVAGLGLAWLVTRRSQ